MKPTTDPRQPRKIIKALIRKAKPIKRIKALIHSSKPTKPATIVAALILCLSANGASAQSSEWYNRAERLEDVPGSRFNVDKIVPRHPLMSTEQHQLTLPSRARARGFVYPFQRPRKPEPANGIHIQMPMLNGTIQYIELDEIQ